MHVRKKPRLVNEKRKLGKSSEKPLDPKAVRFGQRLVKLREEKGIKQTPFARLAGVSISTVHRHETGKKYPDLFTVSKYADALGIPIDTLLDSSEIRSISKVEPVAKRDQVVPLSVALLMSRAGDMTTDEIALFSDLVRLFDFEPKKLDALLLAVRMTLRFDIPIIQAITERVEREASEQGGQGRDLTPLPPHQTSPRKPRKRR